MRGFLRAKGKLAVAVANRYGLAGRAGAARRVYDSLPEEAKSSEDGKKLYAALTDVPCTDTPEARAALEKLVGADAKNAQALACLGSLTRTTDPQRSHAGNLLAPAPPQVKPR